MLGLNYTHSGNKLTIQCSVPDIGSKATCILEAAQRIISPDITAASFTGASLRGASFLCPHAAPRQAPRPHATPLLVRTCDQTG
jgi:hypothetical protein